MTSLHHFHQQQPQPHTEFHLPVVWEHEALAHGEADDMMHDEECLSATSNEEASKVLEQWQADQDEDIEIMEVDAQIGSHLLGDDFFGAPACPSPTGPLEELVLMNLDEDDEDDDAARLFMPILDELASVIGDGKSKISDFSTAATSNNIINNNNHNSTSTSTSSTFEARYEATLQKLQESMRRSQETRKSLTMKTSKTERYDRTQSVSGVLSSIEVSSRQLQGYLKHVQRSSATTL